MRGASSVSGGMTPSELLLGVRQVYTRWLVQHVEPTRTVVWQISHSIGPKPTRKWPTAAKAKAQPRPQPDLMEDV